MSGLLLCSSQSFPSWSQGVCCRHSISIYSKMRTESQRKRQYLCQTEQRLSQTLQQIFTCVIVIVYNSVIWPPLTGRCLGKITWEWRFGHPPWESATDIEILCLWKMTRALGRIKGVFYGYLRGVTGYLATWGPNKLLPFGKIIN